MPSIADRLLALYRAMRGHFGPQHWWPSRAGAKTSEGKLEICVGAILTQNTNWGNVERAMETLRQADALSLKILGTLDLDELARLIRPAGYFNVKARRLRSFVDHVRAAWGEDIAGFLDRPIRKLRPELLGVHGIGRETADSMILYAAGKPSFVVDAYTMRIFLRHGLIDGRADYETVRALCQSRLPGRVSLYNDYHAQLVMVGKHFCKPTARCRGCPLRHFAHDQSA